jgi:hypothetical protein
MQREGRRELFEGHADLFEGRCILGQAHAYSFAGRRPFCLETSHA